MFGYLLICIAKWLIIKYILFLQRGGVLVGKVLKISAIIIDGSDFGRSHLYFYAGYLN